MKKLFALIVLLSCFTFIETRFNQVEAQTIQQLVFSELWNGTSGTPDSINWSQSITDHHRDIITVGNTKTISQMADVLVTKYDRNGVFQWQQTFNNSYDLQDYGIAVTVDNSNNIYVAATSFNDSTNDYDYNILMYDASGSLQWQTYFNGAASKYDVPTAIALDDSGNVIVTGTSYTNSDKFDFLTIKLDGSGNVLWDVSYDYNSETDIPASILILPGRIYVTGGCGSSLFNWDIVTLGYSWNGTLNYSVADTSVGFGFDHPTSMIKDQWGHFYITGSAMNAGNYDMVLMKLDSSLQEIWKQAFDYGNSLPDQGNDIQLNADGNIYITGYVTRASGLKAGYIWGCDTSGAIFFHHEEENGDDVESENLKLAIQPNGQILTTGWKEGTVDKDIYISAFDQSGNSTGYKENKGLYKGDDIPNFIQIINDTVYLSAKVADSDSTFTYYTVQYNLDSILNVLSPNGDEHGSVSFWENRGQIIDTDDSIRHDIKFYTNEGQSLYFSDEFYSYVRSRIDEDTSTDDTLVRIDVTYEQGNRFTKTNSLEKSSADYLNYFLAHCPAGIANVSGYKKLVTKNIYDGIDAIYCWNGNNFNHRIVCNPGSSPSNIEIKFAGADSVTIDASGDLYVWTHLGIIVVPEPINYLEDIDGTITTLGWNTYYQLATDTSVTFFIDTFNASKSLVIEMAKSAAATLATGLEWSTYYGGGGKEEFFDCYTDNADYSYYTGYNTQGDFPTVAGFQSANMAFGHDVVILKFFPTASVEFATYYGGELDESGYSICTDNDGTIYVTGNTISDDLPTPLLNTFSVGGGPFDAFVASIQPNGSAVNWTRYIGGVFEDIGKGIAYEPTDEYIWIVGSTESDNTTAVPFPITTLAITNSYNQTDNPGTSGPGIDDMDGFICRVDKNGALNWCSFFGGVQYDEIMDIHIAVPQDIIYIVGATSSDDYGNYTTPCVVPVTPGFPNCDPGSGAYQHLLTSSTEQDAFVAEFNKDAELNWCTYFGGTGTEMYQHNARITSYSEEYVALTGNTNSASGFDFTSGIANQTTYGGGTTDAFAAIFSERSLIYSTLQGGNGDDIGLGVDMYKADYNHVVFCGSSSSTTGFPLYDLGTPNYYQPDDYEDGYVIILGLTGALQYGTFLGSGYYLENGSDILYGVATTSDEKIYVCGSSENVSYPCVYLNNAYNDDVFGPPLFPNTRDGVITRLGPQGLPVSVNEINEVDLNSSVYPNPADDYTCLFVDSKSSQDVIVQFINVLGQVISEQSVKLNSGFNRIEFNIKNLPSGFYAINILNKDGIIVSHKLIKD